jgi:hypothetical protein
MILVRTFAAIVLILAVSLSACRTDDDKPSPQPGDTSAEYDLEFPAPTFPDGRRLDTVIAIDLDANGRLDYVVTSLSHDTSHYLPPTARADLIQIYRFDTVSRSYVVAASDSAEWITAINLRDVTDDRIPDLVVSLYSGGNDIVASSGMYIYSGHGNRLRPVLKLDAGNPEFKRFKNTAGDVIVSYSELWPDFFVHAEAIPYVDDVFEFRDGEFRSVRTEHQDFFREQATEYLDQYRSARDSVGIELARMAADSTSDSTSAVAYTLFSPAALAMESFIRGGAVTSLRSFWSSERHYLQQTLPDSQFVELEQIYSTSLSEK